ncbi:MAG: hypothetical protein K2N51_12375 [Lachnospiraceae bacterium]|nr:hypothetical protein [Lachnospiraceae bacterium]
MSIWEDFEIDCTQYLNNTFGAKAAFIHQGSSNSTVPDILVQTKSNVIFYIEAKHCPAQCGQFVLLPNILTRAFEYSPKNVNKLNIYAEAIMEHMNKEFDEFREAGTSGKEIILPNGTDIFTNWIIQSYKEKNVHFIITNNYTILPLEDFSKYFYVTAKYRIKRSGSGNVGKSRMNLVKQKIETLDYTISSTKVNGEKLFVTSLENIHNQRFIIQEYEYMFSSRGNEYEVRKLSNTYNANVIFSINLKTTASGLSNFEFESYL